MNNFIIRHLSSFGIGAIFIVVLMIIGESLYMRDKYIGQSILIGSDTLTITDCSVFDSYLKLNNGIAIHECIVDEYLIQKK